jgi:hypothetical protein
MFKIEGDGESGESNDRREREGKYTCSVCGMSLYVLFDVVQMKYCMTKV